MSDESFICGKQDPEKQGRYNISVEGIMTFMAIYGDFNGETWEFDGIAKMLPNPVIWWYPNE